MLCWHIQLSTEIVVPADEVEDEVVNVRPCVDASVRLSVGGFWRSYKKLITHFTSHIGPILALQWPQILKMVIFGCFRPLSDHSIHFKLGVYICWFECLELGHSCHRGLILALQWPTND